MRIFTHVGQITYVGVHAILWWTSHHHELLISLCRDLHLLLPETCGDSALQPDWWAERHVPGSRLGQSQ